MATSELDKIIQMVDSLSDEERQLLVEHIIDSIQPVSQDDYKEEVEFTEEEIAEMLTPEPMTGREIVEAGLTGGWADMGIEDSVEWLKQQRDQRRRRLKW